MCKQCNKRLSRWLSGKESACQCRRSGEVGSVPESGRSPGEEIDNPLQCSCLENSKQKQGSLAGYSPWGCKRVGHSLVTSLSFLLSGSDGKVSAYSTGDLGSIPGLGRSPGEGNGNLLPFSRLENPMDGGAWWATVHGVTKNQTWQWLTHYSCYYYINSTSDHQALDPRGWGHLLPSPSLLFQTSVSPLWTLEGRSR